MANSTRVVGKNAYVQWIGTGGTVTLHPEFSTFDISSETKTADLTAGADTGEYNKGLYRVAGVSIKMFYTSDLGTANLTRLKDGNEGTVTFGWNGTATGQPKGVLPALITKTEVSAPFDKGIEISVEFAPQGDWVTHPFGGAW